MSSVEIDGLRFLKKPRTIFWELLFFGAGSPLAEVFSASPLCDLFCLQNFSLNNEIYQNFIEEDLSAPLNIHQYGFLTGYCYFFGIQDLHAQNLLKKRDGSQPIDVETVFADLISPSQTLLIPGPKIEFGRTPLSKYFPDFSLKLDEVIRLLAGFADASNFFLEQWDTILRAIPDDWKTQHNRVIFRDTRDYEAGKGPFFVEEQLQLDRGDIPYFFKTFVSDDVYYYSTFEKIARVLSVPHIKQKMSNSIGTAPEILLNFENLKARKIPISLLSLAASFRVNLAEAGIVHFQNGQLEICGDKISLQFFEKKFELKL